MEAVLKVIEEKEFHEMKLPLLFDNASTNRCFGIIIKDGIPSFKLAWQSDLIRPVIVEISAGVVTIGIDQNWAIIDLRDNSIPVNLKLTYNFLTTKVLHESVFIATELEVLKMHKTNFKILDTYALPELFEEILFRDNVIEIKCTDNTSIKIP